jgi:hypothetical protein
MAGPISSRAAASNAKEGDVFQLPIDESRAGFGQIVGSRPSTLLVAIFKESHPRSSTPD